MHSARSARRPAHRLFLALWPDDAVRRNVQEHEGDWLIPSGSLRYGPQDWHVTLHFLGRVLTEQAPDIAAAVDVPFERFELVLDQPRVWPGGLAVLCASQLPQPLKTLHDRLGEALRGTGQAVETRTYRPHLTLARRAQDAVPPRAPVPVVWPVQGFVLVVSTGNTAHRYEVLRQYAASPPTSSSRPG